MRAGENSRVLQERKCAASGKVMVPECSTVRDHPTRVSSQSCRATGVSACGISGSGINKAVQHLFETSLKVTSHKTIYVVNILFTAVLLLLVNEVWSNTNYDGN